MSASILHRNMAHLFIVFGLQLTTYHVYHAMHIKMTGLLTTFD